MTRQFELAFKNFIIDEIERVQLNNQTLSPILLPDIKEDKDWKALMFFYDMFSKYGAKKQKRDKQYDKNYPYTL